MRRGSRYCSWMRAWFLRSSLMQPLLCGRIVDDVACNRCDLIPLDPWGYPATCVGLHRRPWTTPRCSHLSLTKEAGRGQPRSRTQGTKKHQFHCATFGPRSNPSNPSSMPYLVVPSDSIRILHWRIAMLRPPHHDLPRIISWPVVTLPSPHNSLNVEGIEEST